MTHPRKFAGWLFFIALAATTPLTHGAENFRIGPSVQTEFPRWLGGGVDALIQDRLLLQAGFGTIPDPYAHFIAQTVSTLIGQGAYKSLIRGFSDSNTAWHAGAQYRFSGATGWGLGMGFTYHSSSGDAPIVDALEAATGLTFSGLRTALANAGKNPLVHGEMSFWTLEARGSYTWDLGNRFFIETSFGVLKILTANLTLSSQATNFDQTQVGQNLYRNAESEITNTLVSNGYSPFAGITLRYLF